MSGMRRHLHLALAAPLLLSSGACGDPVNVNGSYTVALTNGANGCGFQNWREGDTAQGVPLSITQNGAEVSGVVGNSPAALLLLAALGSSTFAGSVSGSRLDLWIYGTRPSTKGSCSYTLNAHVSASLSGDFLAGSIDYLTSTNGSPDCGTLTGCKTTQQLNGTRPPTR